MCSLLGKDFRCTEKAFEEEKFLTIHTNRLCSKEVNTTTCWIDCSQKAGSSDQAVYVACSFRFGDGVDLVAAEKFWDATFCALDLEKFYAPSKALVFFNTYEADLKRDPANSLKLTSSNTLRFFNPLHASLVLSSRDVTVWAKAWVAYWQTLARPAPSPARQEERNALIGYFLDYSAALNGIDPLVLYRDSPAQLCARATRKDLSKGPMTLDEWEGPGLDEPHRQALAALCAFMWVWRSNVTVTPSLDKLCNTAIRQSYLSQLSTGTMSSIRGKFERIVVNIQEGKPFKEDPGEQWHDACMEALDDIITWFDANQPFQTTLHFAASAFQMNALGACKFLFPL